jgi:hypothetical protein
MRSQRGAADIQTRKGPGGRPPNPFLNTRELARGQKAFFRPNLNVRPNALPVNGS